MVSSFVSITKKKEEFKMKEKIESTRNWFKENKWKLIVAGALVGGAVVWYKKLPPHVEVDGLFKDTDILEYSVLHNAERTEAMLCVETKGKRLGKIFLKGPEACISLGKEDAIQFADELYNAVGHVPGVIEVDKF